MRLASFVVCLASLGAALLAAGCATYDPFKVSSVELRRRVRTIALYPLRAPADLVDPEEARALIEPLITRRLVAGGFKVVGSEEVARIHGDAAKAVGDLFDPLTGEQNEANWKLVHAAVRRDLKMKAGVDAILYTSITSVELEEVLDDYAFCGSRGQPYWPTQLPRGERPARALAACFNTVLSDAEDRDLYSIRNGILPIETYAMQTHAALPRGAVLRSVKRLSAAVDKTLGPLADKR